LFYTRCSPRIVTVPLFTAPYTRATACPYSSCRLFSTRYVSRLAVATPLRLRSLHSHSRLIRYTTVCCPTFCLAVFHTFAFRCRFHRCAFCTLRFYLAFFRSLLCRTFRSCVCHLVVITLRFRHGYAFALYDLPFTTRCSRMPFAFYSLVPYVVTVPRFALAHVRLRLSLLLFVVGLCSPRFAFSRPLQLFPRSLHLRLSFRCWFSDLPFITFNLIPHFTFARTFTFCCIFDTEHCSTFIHRYPVTFCLLDSVTAFHAFTAVSGLICVFTPFCWNTARTL